MNFLVLFLKISVISDFVLIQKERRDKNTNQIPKMQRENDNGSLTIIDKW